MSITVRLWTTEELASIKKDKWAATILMNSVTLSKEMMKHYPYDIRRTYLCFWVDGAEETRIYATDERMLLKFIDAEYTRRPDQIHQVIAQYRPVKTS